MLHISSTIRSLFGLIPLLCTSALCLADQLALTNGDILNGTMQEKTDDQVLWQVG